MDEGLAKKIEKGECLVGYLVAEPKRGEYGSQEEYDALCVPLIILCR